MWWEKKLKSENTSDIRHDCTITPADYSSWFVPVVLMQSIQLSPSVFDTWLQWNWWQEATPIVQDALKNVDFADLIVCSNFEISKNMIKANENITGNIWEKH